MGSTKRTGYTQEQIELSTIFKAFGHPARIRIIDVLIQNKSMNGKELSDQLPLSISTISRHLTILAECGILGCQVEKNYTYFTINPTVLSIMDSYLSKHLEQNQKSKMNYTKVYFRTNRLQNSF